MKTRIIAINSKYIHAALAPWYLKSSCGEAAGEVGVMEFTINESPDWILGNIYSQKADVVAFSCYIWNMELIRKVVASLKAIAPKTCIILGGPEVSFDPLEELTLSGFADFILSGEGEEIFRDLLMQLKRGDKAFQGIPGLAYRENGKIIVYEGYQVAENLEDLPSPYTEEMLASVGNRILYYESTRGCPYHCSYCLSSTTSGVRTIPMERVKEDLARFVKRKTRQVKFVDRTFNCLKQRAKEIFSFLLEMDRQCPVETNFHFEMAADLFDEEMFQILSQAPKGLFQFEMGVQTTNEKTLERIRRKTDTGLIIQNVQRLRSMGNIHLHLDLIAGLPLEDLESFRRSFDTVYAMEPGQLQLGFLKLLKGSAIRAEAESGSFLFRRDPPYEILSNAWMDFETINRLKEVEEVLERYYNSGRFAHSLAYLVKHLYQSPFDLFDDLGRYFKQEGWFQMSPSARDLYRIIYQFAELRLEDQKLKVFQQLLKLDFLTTDSSGNLPEILKREMTAGFKEMCFDFLKDPENVKAYLPRYVGVPAKQIYKQVRFEIFEEKRIMLFDYSTKDPVSGAYSYVQIPMDVL